MVGRGEGEGGWGMERVFEGERRYVNFLATMPISKKTNQSTIPHKP